MNRDNDDHVKPLLRCGLGTGWASANTLTSPLSQC